MACFKFTSQAFKSSRLIYLEGEKDAAELWTEHPEKELETVRAGDSAEALMENLKEQYGPEKYRRIIEKYVRDIYPNPGKEDIRNRLIEKAATDYEQKFNNEIATAFADAIKRLEKDHSTTLENIKEHTQTALDELHEKVEASRKSVESRPEVERVGSESEVKNQFETWIINVLDTRMTNDLKGSELAEQMKEGWQTQINEKINLLFEEERATPENIKKIKKDFEYQLSDYSNFDGERGNLSLKDAQMMLQEAAVIDSDLIKLIESGNVAEVTEALEARFLVNPEVWQQASTMTADLLVEDAIRNGNEQALIDAVNQHAETVKNVETVTDFDDAVSAFKAIVESKATAGVRETLTVLEAFNQTLNHEKKEIFASMRPASLQPLIWRERQMLLDRRLIPQNTLDKTLVEFMSTNREGRNDILANPVQREELFRAIKITQKDYKKHFKENYSGLPKKTSELISRPTDPSRPTSHDKAARVAALIMLGREAEWVIKTFQSSPDYKSVDLLKELDQTQIVRRGREDRYEPNTDFRDIHKNYSTAYKTIAARNGFNGRDLALGVVKVTAGFTVFANVMNAWKNDKKGLIDNPFMYAGIGLIYGINKYKENREVSQYLKASAGKKEKIKTHANLNSLSEKLGIRRLKNFINQGSEWEAMRHLKAKKINGLVEKARERYAPHPVITKEDLQDKVPEQVWAKLEGKENGRERFLFYQKLLTDDQNIDQLKEHAQKWKN